MILSHALMAGLLCTTGLLLLALEGLRHRAATASVGFLACYGAAMALWAALSWRSESNALAVISMAQLGSVAALALRGRA